MKMGNLISTFCCNSKVSSKSRIQDCSTLSLDAERRFFIQTFREQSLAPTSSHILRRTEIQSLGENSRSMEDLVEAEHNRRMTLTPLQLTQAVRQRLSTF
nr:AC4 protein [Begomovirus mozlegume]UEE00985.1 AC4 protein [Begomovirus mozlegume]UEE00996.1 AC4 protein [Begomovirus mozlegume]UEE01008.1 AC4 protein [Begomovirus mozlegume]UEE01014.1 AC4 protein [Begomovirus mozlegume]